MRQILNVNENPGSFPAPRSDGGKCGAYLAAVKLLQDMGIEKTDSLEAEFIRRFGSLKCGDLRKSGQRAYPTAPGCPGERYLTIKERRSSPARIMGKRCLRSEGVVSHKN